MQVDFPLTARLFSATTTTTTSTIAIHKLQVFRLFNKTAHPASLFFSSASSYTTDIPYWVWLLLVVFQCCQKALHDEMPTSQRSGHFLFLVILPQDAQSVWCIFSDLTKEKKKKRNIYIFIFKYVSKYIYKQLNKKRRPEHQPDWTTTPRTSTQILACSDAVKIIKKIKKKKPILLKGW